MPCPNLLKVVYLRLKLQAIRKTRVALQLTSFACLGILSEIAASSTLRKISRGACVTHGSLNARQSDNFIEFLRNALSQPPESILSSFRIAKRLGKRE